MFQIMKLDGFRLKVIAVICMIISNGTWPLVDILTFPVKFILHVVGGVTFVTMAFLAIEGYRHTKNLKKYIQRLIIFGAIATPFHVITFGMPFLNIMFTIVLGLWTVLRYDKLKERSSLAFWLIFVFIIIPFSAIFVEFFFVGVTTMLLYHLIRDERMRRIVPPVFMGSIFLLLGVAGTLFFGTPEPVTGIFHNAHLFSDSTFMLLSIPFALFMLCVPFLLIRYNGERGKPVKWFFYIEYPVQLAVFALLSVVLGVVDLGVLLG